VYSSRRGRRGGSLNMSGRIERHGTCPKSEGHSFTLARDFVLNGLVVTLLNLWVHFSRGQCSPQ
jgi:hypothetical protein